jgi:hypothetical protein
MTKETATQELFTVLTSLFDDYRDQVISHKTFEERKQQALKECLEKEMQQILEFGLFLSSDAEHLKSYIRDQFYTHYEENYLVDFVKQTEQ